MNKIYVTWQEVMSGIRRLNIDYEDQNIYGVPKGGMIAAGFLQNATSVYDPKVADFILDDIIDSGKTREYYEQKFPGKRFVSLVTKVDYNQDDWIVFPWEADHPAGEDTIQENIVRQLQYIGEDPKRNGLLETPNRVVKSWDEIYAGYKKEPQGVFKEFDADNYDNIVLAKGFDFYSVCEHHLLPFYGKAWVAYIPSTKRNKIIGISKLIRLFEIYSNRLQVQERLCKQVVDALNKHLEPLGAACIVEGIHMCMVMRGVKKVVPIDTSCLTGAFRNDASARNELMHLMNLKL